MITTKLIFDRRKMASRTHEGYVEVRITIDRKTMYISTGVRVYKNEWAAGCIVNRPDANVLNDRLAIIFEKVHEGINESVKQGVKLDVESVKRMVWQQTEIIKDGPTLLDWISDQIPLLDIGQGTRKRYHTLMNRLAEYGKLTRWEDVTVENITLFDSWLHQLNDGAISDSAVYNYHKCLKALLHRADQFGKIDRNPYERMKLKRGEKENIEYLTEDEMKAFERLLVPDCSLMAFSHDLFVFQMYTGLAFSDMQAFDIRQYRKEGDTYRHTGERIKTGVAYVSQLLPPAVRIIEKYGGRLPKIDNADYNHNLKALGVMAGITIPLHSHLARHTFATYMLRNGAKIENVSRMLGHTNITQTQRYAKVLAQSVHDDFDKIAEKIKDKGQ
jgi:site-specific recombinase XerD